jgi:hypothetical protein
MRAHKHILLYCPDEFRCTELRMIMELHLLRVTVASGIGIATAVRAKDFHCAVLVKGTTEIIDFLRARDIPTLEIGQSPSYADRVVSGEHMMDVLEAVKVMCSRKRGPKVKVAA